MIENKEKIPLAVWKADLLQKVIERWGIPAQMDMLMEECAELIVALQHLRRGRIGWDEVAEEMADVKIMIGQMEVIDGVFSLVNEKEMEKLLRLEERLK